jgi:4'-phosphopantetheinyl transferase
LSAPFASPRLPIAPQEVHVWRLHADQVTNPAMLQRFHALLSSDEAERQTRFAHERTRREYLLARGLARTVLASYTGLRPQALRFTADAFGKPQLCEPPDDPSVHFNLSHSHGVIVCAVALGRQVGIDVEDAGRRIECLDLAERYFAPAEVAHLRRLAEQHRQAAFFAIWTLKEAFVKATGHGLSFPLDAFAFELERDRLLRFCPPAALPGQWRFYQFEPTERHRGALAVECNGADVRVVMRDWAEVFDR